mmetsp:Transcript_35049/g.83304  ORF Transcript_35049/g.83304 Transcript_35049/m.83304 type:complete len:152 (+) Transcript_35049:142-597(+)
MATQHVNGVSHSHSDQVHVHVDSANPYDYPNEDDDTPPATASAQRGVGRISEYEGNSVLYMKGKLVCGPPGSYRMVVFTLFLVVCPMLLYFSKPAVFLSSELSPAIPIGALLLLISSLLSYATHTHVRSSLSLFPSCSRSLFLSFFLARRR